MRFSMPIDRFLIVARAAVGLASKDAVRPALQTVRLVGEDGRLSVESTNAYVLGRWEYPKDYVVEDGELRIMKPTLDQVIRHIGAVPAAQRRNGTVEVAAAEHNRADIVVTPSPGDFGSLQLSGVRLFDGVMPTRPIPDILAEYMYRDPDAIDRMTKAELVDVVAAASWERVQQTVRRIILAEHGSKKDADKVADGWVTKLRDAVGARQGTDRREFVARWVNRHFSAGVLRADLAATLAGKQPGIHTDMAFNPEYVKAIVKAAEPITDGHIPLRYYSDHGVKPLHVWAERAGVGRFDGLVMPVRV